MSILSTLPTRNEGHGLWATLPAHNRRFGWATTSAYIRQRFCVSAEEARDLMDSTFGRHLADQLPQHRLTQTEIEICLGRLFKAGSAWSQAALRSLGAMRSLKAPCR